MSYLKSPYTGMSSLNLSNPMDPLSMHHRLPAYPGKLFLIFSRSYGTLCSAKNLDPSKVS